ncbi:unnamed protein product [Coffea canephora]|uniref:Protein SPIRAL1-like 5 n=1 Tax=Coffea canephora TaxID=49390 RepID=A0A068UWP5_COFCA|nr:unnamed protein product [Coffea canephora]
MSRRESYGGGQSSLGYLFGSDDKKKDTAPPATPVVFAPPYGIDTGEEEKPPDNPSPSSKGNVSGDPKRSPKDLNSGKSITIRPSTKVKSVPGGDSSLGYLFGDKS